MTTRVKHLSEKFVDFRTDPAQLIAHGVEQQMEFGIFLLTKVFVTP